jgi:hypothetical protein
MEIHLTGPDQSLLTTWRFSCQELTMVLQLTFSTQVMQTLSRPKFCRDIPGIPLCQQPYCPWQLHPRRSRSNDAQVTAERGRYPDARLSEKDFFRLTLFQFCIRLGFHIWQVAAWLGARRWGPLTFDMQLIV